MTSYKVNFTYTFTLMELFTYSPEMPEEDQEYMRISQRGAGAGLQFMHNPTTCVAI